METNREQFHQCVVAKEELLAQLLAYGQRQQQHLVSGETVELLKVLADKQGVIDRMAQLEQQIQQLQNAPAADRNWNSSDLKTKTLQIVERCNALGRQALELERACENMAAERRDRIANQIPQFSRLGSSSSANVYSEDETHLASFDESS